MSRLFFACGMTGCHAAPAAQAPVYPNVPPPAPPRVTPPPQQPVPQVRPPEIAIPSAPVRPTPSTGFHDYPTIGPAGKPVARRKGYGDRVTPCIQRGRKYGLDDRDMNAYVARCAGGDY